MNWLILNKVFIFTDAGRHEIDSSQSNLVKKSLSSSISWNSGILIRISIYIAPENQWIIDELIWIDLPCGILGWRPGASRSDW